MFLKLIGIYFRLVPGLNANEDGQSTAEYALVIVAVAALAGLLISWISKSGFFGGLFGKIGGWIMSQVDIAGSIPAIELAQGRVATIAVNSFVFRQPVMIGDVVSFYAKVVRVGRTSITVDVEVYARRRALLEVVKVTETGALPRL